jgi:hypothetical protein
MMKLSYLASLVCLPVAVRCAALTYPSNIEIDIVFPRNDTYAAVTPFPIVFGFQNAEGVFGFGSSFDYQVTCKNGSLQAFWSFSTDETKTSPVANDPFFYANVSRSLESGANGRLVDANFPRWRGDSDTCQLKWSCKSHFRMKLLFVLPEPFSLFRSAALLLLAACTFGKRVLFWQPVHPIFDLPHGGVNFTDSIPGWYSTNCTRETDGALRIGFGYKERSGTVNFTIKPNAPLPADVINSYSECPLFGTSVGLKSNETGCPQVGTEFPSANPCGLTVGSAAASNILAQIPTPIFTFSPTGTSGSTNPTRTGSSTGNKDGAAGRTQIEGTTIALVAALLFIVVGPLFLL